MRHFHQRLKKSFTSEDIRKQVFSGATGKTVNKYIFFIFLKDIWAITIKK